MNQGLLADASAPCSWTLQEAAEQALEYALRHCHRAALQNKSRILYFLVPVKMLLGQLPAQAALQKYQLEEYAEIVDVSLLLQSCWSPVLKKGNRSMLHMLITQARGCGSFPLCMLFQAMRTGSVQKLNDSLEAQQWRFIRAGTYLVLEKLKQSVLRRLLKKVALLNAETNPGKANQLPLGAHPLPNTGSSPVSHW